MNVISLGAIRASQTNDAADWSPIDCLKDVITGIEEGRIKPEGLIVAFYEQPEPGKTKVHFSCAMPNVIMAAGTLQRVQNELGLPT